MNNKIAIIGSGAMATAVAKVLTDTSKVNPNIVIYGVNEEELKELSNGMNSKYFPNSIKLPKFTTSTSMSETVKDAKYIILAVPSKTMDIVIAEVLGSINSEALFINVAKGFFPRTKLSIHEGIVEVTKHNEFVRGVVSLIGPSHAEEIVMQVPTAVAAVSKHNDLNEEVQKLFSNSYFKVYSQRDVKGAMAGAAYKNVLAIASGMVSGLGFGINTTAALLTRGLNEMSHFNKSQGGKKETIMGLTGIGDLIVTATSDLSRNFTFGKEFVKNNKVALEKNSTVEGLVAIDYIYEIAKEEKLELPIVSFLHGVIHGKKKVEDFKTELWDRKLKEE